MGSRCDAREDRYYSLVPVMVSTGGRPESTAPLLTLVLEALEAQLSGDSASEPILDAFIMWVGGPGRTDTAAVEFSARDAASHAGARRQYRDVAVLGFACATLGGGHPEVEAWLRPAFRDGVEWLRGRRFFLANQPHGFEADAIAVMGVAAGIALGQPAAADGDEEWLESIIQQSRSSNAPTWDDSLLHGALLLLHRSKPQAVGPMERPAGLAPDLAAVLAAKGVLRLTPGDELDARTLILAPEYRHQSHDRAGVQIAALRWLMREGARALPRRATVGDLIELLEGLPHALRRWPWEDAPRTKSARSTAQRWDVQNEYHVQSLLWTILAPVFPDLKDEEYLRSVGHKHPRVDLAVPSLGVIIEVKFLRSCKQRDLAGLIEEVSADTGFYLSNPSDFTQIVTFIWDDAQCTDQHGTLLAGLRMLKGITDAVVVSRPGRFSPRGSGE